MATIKDVAKAAGVGTGTVSRALSGKGYVDSEKKKQIIKIAEQLEYDPSALLKRKNNKKVKRVLQVDRRLPLCSVRYMLPEE